jgi:hypothetical protein
MIAAMYWQRPIPTYMRDRVIASVNKAGSSRASLTNRGESTGNEAFSVSYNVCGGAISNSDYYNRSNIMAKSSMCV